MIIIGAIKIHSVQANSLWKVNRGDDRAFLDLGKAVLNDSIFTEYMRKHGVTVNRKNESKDFVVMKFDFGLKKHGEYKKISSNKLRDFYYKNGASITWNTFDKETGKPIKDSTKTIHYKMLMRTTGKAKDGDCVFIREDLHKLALDYITMGLYDRMPYNNAAIVELSAYAPLITATALDYIEIPMKNIFIVKDEEISTDVNAVAVKVHEVKAEREKIDFAGTEEMINDLGMTFYKKKQKRNPELIYINRTIKALENHGISRDECPKKIESFIKKECYVDRKEKKRTVTNVLWDGMGLIDTSIFPEEKGMDGFIYCRSHFFKSCLFRGSIQQYFKDYYGDKYETAIVTDMFGNKFKVKDIKVIVTDKSIKWMKFIDLMGDTEQAAYLYYKKYMNKHKNIFAIIKTAHNSKWGDIQRGSYQAYSSLPCTDKEILKSIAKETIDYCNALKLNHKAFMRHLEITGSKRYSINNVLIALDSWNDCFKYTKYFKEKKNKIISEFKNERLKLGKLLQYGDNLTICGNPIALLMKVTGQDFKKEKCFQLIENGIQCYTTRFRDGERIAGFRSPHNSPNNIIHLINVYSKEMQEYFSKLGNNVIVINGLYTDVQSRLNGQDLDSDAIYATNQKDIVKLAEEAYLNYPTIINDVPLDEKTIYNKDMESFAKMDSKISSAQVAIGRSSNIAQLALCYYYDGGSKSQDLEDVFIMCSVLAQVAIDSAKRQFVIKVHPELDRIYDLDCMKKAGKKKYPQFYADVQGLKGHKIEKDEIGEYNCPMQILYDVIEEGVMDLRKCRKQKSLIYNLNIVFEYKADKKRDSKQHKKIIGIVQEYDSILKDMNEEDEDYSQNVLRYFDECTSKIKKLSINSYTMSSLIAYAFSSNGDIRDRLLIALYDSKPSLFLKCFKMKK